MVDLKDSAASIMAEKEEKTLRNYDIGYKLFNITMQSPDSVYKSLASTVRSMKKPLLVHSFTTTDPISQKFLAAYKQ